MTDRIPYGEETHIDWELDQCHDCGVERGELHRVGCDAEQCPVCGTQLIACLHLDEVWSEP